MDEKDFEALHLDNQVCFPIYAASRLVCKRTALFGRTRPDLSPILGHDGVVGDRCANR